MARRTGVPTLLALSQRICILIVKFSPIIAATFPGNTALLSALSAANTACAALADELALVREIGD